MILKIFVRPNCPNCPPAKKLGEEIEKSGNPKIKVEWYNSETVDGMAEAAFYQVMATPTLLLLNDEEKIIGEWRGKAPVESAILAKIKN